MTAFIVIGSFVILFAIVYFVIRIIKKRRLNETTVNKKDKKIKIQKEKKSKEIKETDGHIEIKGSYVDLVNKFLFRKEFKVLVLVTRILPKGYVAFPKIGLDTILEPVGRKDLFERIKNCYLDIVIFDEVTMKPKAAIDIFDGSIGDEQVEIATPDVTFALKTVELPLISLKVKTDYSENEIKDPIYKALNINVEEKKEDENMEIDKQNN